MNLSKDYNSRIIIASKKYKFYVHTTVHTNHKYKKKIISTTTHFHCHSHTKNESQQTFIDLHDVLKTSSKYFLKTSWRCLQRNIFLYSKK